MRSMRPFELPDQQSVLSLGARPLGSEPVLLVDAPTYGAVVAGKTCILADDYHYYFQALPESRGAQWEVIELLLPELASTYPDYFQLAQQHDYWIWSNRLLNQRTLFTLGDETTLPYPPLDWLGRQLQEDLLLLMGEAEGFPLVAGQLCFANHWCLDDKMGRSLLTIHDPVPGYAEQVGRQSDLLLARLRHERPVWRRNWSISVSPELNLAPRFSAMLAERKAAITATNAGEGCFYRSERQVLMRLPRSGAVLFTIYTDVAPIGRLAADPDWAARMLYLLRSMPPALLAYKGISPYAAALCSYLERKADPNEC